MQFDLSDTKAQSSTEVSISQVWQSLAYIYTLHSLRENVTHVKVFATESLMTRLTQDHSLLHSHDFWCEQKKHH